MSQKSKRKVVALALLLTPLLGVATVFLYLNRGLSNPIEPASFRCLDPAQGEFVTDAVALRNIYGVGLSYAKHINETASAFDIDLDPPVFAKSSQSVAQDGSLVALPGHAHLQRALESLEPGIGQTLEASNQHLHALLDHEVELAFVLLDDVSPEQLAAADFVPALGFTVANDLSARSIAILGEGQPNRYDYWGVSKSFAGFTPISQPLWVPHMYEPDAIPCIELRTEVNGEVRQLERSDNLIYTPVEMLRAIHRKFPDRALQAGDIVLTGTPGGVIFNTPRWKVRLAEWLGLDRWQKLALTQTETRVKSFLQPGDQVRVSAEWLGEVTVTIGQ